MTAPQLDANETDPATLWAEIWRLRHDAEGPAGYDTWKDAAVAERVRRVKAEADAARYHWLREHTSGTGLVRWMQCHRTQFLDVAVDRELSAKPAAKPCEWTNCPTRVGNVCCNDRAA